MPLISALGRQSQADLCEGRPGLHSEIWFYNTNSNKSETWWKTPLRPTSGSLRQVDRKPNIGFLGWEPQRNGEGTDVREALIEGEVINLAAKASLGIWVLNASQDRQFLKGRSRCQAEQNGFCEHLQRGTPRAKVQYAIPVCL